MIKIGINVAFQASGGSLRNLSQLLIHWQEAGILQKYEFYLFLSMTSYENLKNLELNNILNSLNIIILGSRHGNIIYRLFYEQYLLVKLLKENKIDIIFCPGNTMPYFTNLPCVTTFQNAAPFCKSITLKSVGLKKWVHFYFLGLFMRLSAMRSTKIIFISQYFKNLFVSNFNFPVNKAEVIYRGHGFVNANNSIFQLLKQKYKLNNTYILLVSRLNPYKNIIEILEAYKRAKDQSKIKYQLVIAGGGSFPEYRNEIDNKLKNLGIHKNDILLLGEIPQHEITPLMMNCNFFIFSSTCENCPTALIEAISLGLPIACSNIGVMKEIAGNSVAYFDPYDIKDIEKVLIKLMTDECLRNELKIRSTKRAKELPSRMEEASKTINILEDVINNKPLI